MNKASLDNGWSKLSTAPWIAPVYDFHFRTPGFPRYPPEFSSAMSWWDRQSLVLYGLFMVLAVAGWKTQGDAGLVLFMEDELATMGWFLGIPVATWVVIQALSLWMWLLLTFLPGAKGWRGNLLHVNMQRLAPIQSFSSSPNWLNGKLTGTLLSFGESSKFSTTTFPFNKPLTVRIFAQNPTDSAPHRGVTYFVQTAPPLPEVPQEELEPIMSLVRQS